MKFQQTIEGTPGVDDLIEVTVLFEAATWADAAKVGDAVKKQLGLKGTSTITYAPRTEAAPLHDLIKEDADREVFTAQNGGVNFIQSTEGHRA